MTEAIGTAAGTAAIGDDTWAAALAALDGHDEIVLACHVSPDGDALGSMLAVAQALVRRGGVRVVPSFSEPFTVPETLRFLPGLDLLVPPDRVPAEPGLLVTFDTGSADRLGSLAPLVTAARAVVVLDHHASNTRYGTVHLVDPAAAATAVLAADLVARLGVPLDADIAAALYTGLASDTGSFRYAGTTPEVHALAGRLLATGIRHDEIARAIFDTHPFGWVEMLAAVLARTRLEPAAAGGRGLVWTWSTVEDLTSRGLAADHAESVIDIVRTTAEAEVAVVLKQQPGGEYAVSVRSKGQVDVSRACVALGGGGHRFAAGFTSYDSVTVTMDRLRGALDDQGSQP